VIAGVGRIKAQFRDVNCDIDDVFCNTQACAEVFKAGQWAAPLFCKIAQRAYRPFLRRPSRGFAAYSTASFRLSALAIPCPAMSMAVPLATGVRRFGKST